MSGLFPIIYLRKLDFCSIDMVNVVLDLKMHKIKVHFGDN